MNSATLSKPKLLKLTLIFAATLFVLLLLLNIVLNRLTYRLLSPMFDWFLLAPLPEKLVFTFLVAPILISILLAAFKLAGESINYVLLSFFPYTQLAYNLSLGMCIISIIIGVINILPFLSWNVWMILLWMLASLFIVQLNIVFLFKSRKQREAEEFI